MGPTNCARSWSWDSPHDLCGLWFLGGKWRYSKVGVWALHPGILTSLLSRVIFPDEDEHEHADENGNDTSDSDISVFLVGCIKEVLFMDKVS